MMMMGLIRYRSLLIIHREVKFTYISGIAVMEAFYLLEDESSELQHSVSMICQDADYCSAFSLYLFIRNRRPQGPQHSFFRP